MPETPLEKLLRLATTDVRGFQRVVRGRVQEVHPHVETRADAAKASGWISEPLWKEGQQDWEKAGAKADVKGQVEAHDSAHDKAHDTASADAKAKMAADKAAREAKAAKAGGVRPGADNRRHISGTSPKAKARAARMAARHAGTGKPLPSNGTPLLHGGPMAAPGSLQDRVESMEQDRQGVASRVSGHSLFNQPGPGASESEKLISDAASKAVQNAAVASGQIDQTGMSHVMAEMAELEARMSASVQEKAREVEHQQDIDQKEDGRATLALNIIGIVAGILLAATTGGIGAIVGEVMAFGWTAQATQALLQYHGIDSKSHPAVSRALGHPIQTAAGAAAKVAKPLAQATKPVVSQAAAKVKQVESKAVKAVPQVHVSVKVPMPHLKGK